MPNKGGLVAFSWHWRDPALLKTAEVNSAKFYARETDSSKNTTFTIPLAQGALDKTSPAYQQINDGIDLIAVELSKLSDAGVTVLWRPLHEASGYMGDGWFWWGRTRTDGAPPPYANILSWRHLYDRLVHVHVHGIAADGAWWLWFMVWNDGDSAPGVTDSNNFWRGQYYNTNGHKKKVYNYPNVITLDRQPQF